MADDLDHVRALIAETPFPSAEAQKSPYPYYDALREAGPVVRLPSGEYVVSRHADILEVARQPDVFSSRHGMFADGWMRVATLDDLRDETVAWGIVNSDAPAHTTKRLLAMQMFRPDQLKRHIAMIETQIDALIDAFIDRGQCDFVSEFADLLPAKVILSMFDLPPEDLGRMLEWRHYEGAGMRYAEHGRRAAGRDSILDLGGYIRDQVLERADHPGEDELSLHVQRHVAHHGKLDMPNLIAEASNLFIGGIITTTHLLANAMRLFIENPDQQAKARASKDGLKAAIEEALRVDAPVQLSLRMTTRAVELGGEAIPAGSIVIVVWASANRDGSVFDHADGFDIERRNVRSHLSFGAGEHLCLGARLGRLEAQLAFEHIFARMTNLRFAPGRNDFENLDAVIFRGLRSLHIEFDPA